MRELEDGREDHGNEEEDDEQYWGDENVVKAPVATLFGLETYGQLYNQAVFDRMRREGRYIQAVWNLLSELFRL